MLVVLDFAVLPPPLETLALQILHVAVKLVGIESLKNLQTPCFLAPSMLN